MRANYQIDSHLDRYNARPPDAWVDFDEKLFPEFAAGVMWNCALEIFDCIANDSYLLSEFKRCHGDLLFLECATFPPIAIIVLEDHGYLGDTAAFSTFYEVLDLMYLDLESFYRAQKESLIKFQEQCIDQYTNIENVEDWFKAVCSMFYQLIRARSNPASMDIASEIRPLRIAFGDNLEASLKVQIIAESSLAEAIEHIKNVIYDFSYGAL